MGAWGTAIFDDDTAADVREEFTDLIAEGLSTAAATKRIIAENRDILDDPDDRIVFWLALAATQSKLGRLIPDARKKALRIIDSDVDNRRWRGTPESLVKQRKKHLEDLRKQLTGAQPQPKKVRRRSKSSTQFKPGDVATFRLTNRTSVRFCVLGIWGDLGGTYADLCLLGLDDGKPFRKGRLTLADTLGPHYTMVNREPADRITILRRGVALPEANAKTFRAWNSIKIDRHACTWDRFPVAVRKVLRRLRWRITT